MGAAGVSTHTFSALLAVTAWNGAIADYSHTARTTLGVTAGVEYVGSASGVFLSEPATTATPEPATLGSVGLGGLLLLGARARRRRA